MHIATVGFSVRNWLALKGPQHPVAILEGLRQAWHERLDEEEVRRALGELVKREMVERGPDDRYAARDRAFLHHRASTPAVLSELDQRAWEGWH